MQHHVIAVSRQFVRSPAALELDIRGANLREFFANAMEKARIDQQFFLEVAIALDAAKHVIGWRVIGCPGDLDA